MFHFHPISGSEITLWTTRCHLGRLYCLTVLATQYPEYLLDTTKITLVIMSDYSPLLRAFSCVNVTSVAPFFRNLFSILIILYLGRNTRKWLLNRLCREIFRFSASFFLFWSWVIDMSRRSQKTYVYSNRIAFVFVQYHFHVTRLTTPNSLCPYRDLFHRNWGCYVNL